MNGANGMDFKTLMESAEREKVRIKEKYTDEELAAQYDMDDPKNDLALKKLGFLIHSNSSSSKRDVDADDDDDKENKDDVTNRDENDDVDSDDQNDGVVDEKDDDTANEKEKQVKNSKDCKVKERDATLCDSKTKEIHKPTPCVASSSASFIASFALPSSSSSSSISLSTVTTMPSSLSSQPLVSQMSLS